MHRGTITIRGPRQSDLATECQFLPVSTDVFLWNGRHLEESEKGIISEFTDENGCSARPLPKDCSRKGYIAGCYSRVERFLLVPGSSRLLSRRAGFWKKGALQRSGIPSPEKHSAASARSAACSSWIPNGWPLLLHFPVRERLSYFKYSRRKAKLMWA